MDGEQSGCEDGGLVCCVCAPADPRPACTSAALGSTRKFRERSTLARAHRKGQASVMIGVLRPTECEGRGTGTGTGRGSGGESERGRGRERGVEREKENDKQECVDEGGCVWVCVGVWFVCTCMCT